MNQAADIHGARDLSHAGRLRWRACRQLNIDGTSDARSATLANVIMELAAKGERAQLLQWALEAVSQSEGLARFFRLQLLLLLLNPNRAPLDPAVMAARLG